LQTPYILEESSGHVSARASVLGQVATVDSLPYNHSDIVFMECPFCRHDIAAAWQLFVVNTDHLGRHTTQFQTQLHTAVARGKTRNSVTVTAHWLQCQNVDCQEIVIQITRAEANQSPLTETWIALPKRPSPPAVNQLVTDPFKKDYLEAWTILTDSPRMSAVLSRRLLADLLEKYAGLNQWSLAQRIDAFVADTRYPQWLRQNLHYVREAGDFGAHKQEDKTASATTAQQTQPAPLIIDVSKEEAEWTLKNIADLFEYFIIGPEKDKEMRAALDKKISGADRKPISTVVP
jgi:Domain of unknown function (DUF4145)